MSGEEGKVAAIPPSPKILISDPWQMRKDEFWGRLALLEVCLCPWSHSSVSVLPG